MSQFAALFDWNGTLLDDVHEVHYSVAAVQEHFGFPPCSFGDYQKHYEMPIDRIYLNLGFSQEMIHENRDVIYELFHRTYSPLESKAALREGATRTLQRLNDNAWHCAILSNHLEGAIAAQCERHDLAVHLKGILANKNRAEQMAQTPKGDRLHAYMEKHGLRHDQTIIVGDTPEEIRIAHEQSMIGVAITGGYASEERLRTERPDFLIHHLDEIPAIADKLSAKGRVR